MQGKILANGLIVGVDGKRYTFGEKDLKNAGSKSGDALVGCEVDFEAQDEKAVQIFITKQAFNADDLKQRLLSSDLNGIKFKVYVMLACVVLSFIPFVGFLFAITAITLTIFIVIALNKASQSTSLLKNFIIYAVLIVVGSFIFSFSGIGALALFSGGGFGAVGFFTIFVALLSLAIFAGGGYYLYLYYKELAYITNEQFFMYSFWCALVGFLTIFIFVGFLFLLAYFVLYLIAWVRTQEIRKSYSALS